MNQYSNFQLEHPLSVRKKFWKKLIVKSIQNLFYSIIAGSLTAYLVSFVFLDKSNSSGSFYITLFTLSIFLVFLILNTAYGIYVSVYIRRYYYDCGEKFITIKKGVFAPTEIHVQYPKIQDVYVDQDVLDRIMGLYDVHIASATFSSGIEAHIDGVSAEVAEKIKNVILDKIQTQSVATNNTNPGPQTPQTPSDQKIVFSEKISSANYPINNSWLVATIISYFISNVIWTIALLAFFWEIIRNSSAGNASMFFGYGLLVFFVVYFLRIIYLLIWKSNYYFEFTPEFVTLKTGVISRQESHLPYRSIQNISTSQGVIDRIFGLAYVSIENATSIVLDTRSGAGMQLGTTIIGQSIEKAEHLNQVLNKIVVSVKNPGATGL